MTDTAIQATTPVTAATRFALLTALEAAIKSEKDALKPEIVAQALATDATGFNSPFGKISLTVPKDTIGVSNELALIEYVKATYPQAVQTIEVAEEWARAAVLDSLRFVKDGVAVDGQLVAGANIVEVPGENPEAKPDIVVFGADGAEVTGATVGDYFHAPDGSVVTFVTMRPGGPAYPAYPSSPAKKATVAAATEFLRASAPALVEALKEITQ